jgi:hypothetical protein
MCAPCLYFERAVLHSCMSVVHVAVPCDSVLSLLCVVVVVSLRRTALVVRDPVHDLTEAVTVREGPDIDADPTACPNDRTRLAMDLALLQVPRSATGRVV